MPTYGRRNNPTEHHIKESIDQRNVLNRTIRAQVSTVDAENGFVVLTYENLPSGGKYATVQPLWMSFPDAKIGAPAWGRFIPQQGDLVRISFDYDDRPVILGHDITAARSTVADGLSGWPLLNEEYKKARGPDAPADRAKFAQFTPLKPGEYDFMSSGGAYVYGNNRGRLYLAGGNVSITLVKNDLRISQRAQLLSHSADDCELRFGQVRRNDPADQLEKKVSSDSNGLFKEFAVVLKKTISAGTTANLTTLKLGNVVDDTGSVLSGVNPYRLYYQSFIDAGTESLKMTIDNLGNWDVLAPTEATTGVTFDFSAGDWTTKFKTATHTNSDKTSIDSPNINLGAIDATEHLILGDKYRSAEETMIKDLADQLKNLADAVSTFCTTIAPTCASAVTTSPGSPIASVIAIGTATIPLNIATQAVKAQAPIVATTFTSKYSTYLSEISKTK